MTATSRQNSILIGIAILLIAALAVTFPTITSSTASYTLVNIIEPVGTWFTSLYTHLVQIISNLL